MTALGGILMIFYFCFLVLLNDWNGRVTVKIPTSSYT